MLGLKLFILVIIIIIIIIVIIIIIIEGLSRGLFQTKRRLLIKNHHYGFNWYDIELINDAFTYDWLKSIKQMHCNFMVGATTIKTWYLVSPSKTIAIFTEKVKPNAR